MHKPIILSLLCVLIQAKVLELDKSNFQQAIDSNPTIIVAFFKEGCQYCIKMKPVFEKLSERLEEYQIVLGAVDVDSNKVFSAKLGVKAYPEIFMYRNGKQQYFIKSSDSLEMLFEYALQKSYDTITTLENQQDIDLFVKRSNIAILAYNNEDLGGQAINNDWLRFGQITNQELKQGHEYAIYNHKFKNPIYFDGDKHSLIQFVNQNAYPDVFTFTEEEFRKARFDKLPLIAVYSTEDDIIYRRLSYISENMKDQFRFVLIKLNDELPQKRFTYQIGKQDIKLKTGILYGYNFQSETSLEIKIEKDEVEDLRNYVKQVLNAEKVEVSTGIVLTLTDQNFKSVVIDSPKNVLVKFYAPWCGHCKQLAPIYEQLATAFVGREDIIIAELDYTAYPIADVKLEGYPTIILFKKVYGTLYRVEYEGQRTVEQFSKFLDEEIPNSAEIGSNGFPASKAIEINKQNLKELVFDSGKNTLLWFYADYCEHSKRFNEVYNQIFKKYQNKLQIARTNGVENQYEYFYIDTFPKIYFINDVQQIILFTKERTFENLSEFIDNNLKEDEIQTENKGNVIQLTANTFKQTVLNSDKTVFVKFFAPWCGHCKHMAQAYIDLAEQMAGYPNVLIAEMDWTIHKVPDVNVRGFPTLILFTKNPNDQKQYSGNRSTDDMSKFIKENLKQKDDL